MSDDWRQWKVRDKLEGRPELYNLGRRVGVDYQHGPYKVIEVSRLTIGVRLPGGEISYFRDFGSLSNPSTFFFLPPLCPYKPGDRVKRENVDVASVLPGTLGEVISVTKDEVDISWDGHSQSQTYSWPERAAYFSLVSTGQAPKPVLCCERCGEYNEYAEPNMPNGNHRCRQCRKDPWR